MKKYRTFNIGAYPFILLLTILVAGILIQQQLSLSISGTLWLLLCLASFVGALICHQKSILEKAVLRFRNGLLLVAFLFLGASISHYQDTRSDHSWYGHSLTEIEGFKISVDATPIDKPKTILMLGAVQSVLINGHWSIATGKIKIYVYKKADNRIFYSGQVLLVPNRLIAIKPSGNPFSFNTASYSNRNGYYHQCFISNDEIVPANRKKQSPSMISALREAIKTSIHKNVRDTITRGLIDAMLVNDRSSIDQDLLQAYSTTGIIHILAISGMHVILLAAIILWIFGKIPLGKVKNSKHIIALLVVWIYIAITGFPPSANRAAVMFSIYAIGILLNRDASSLNTWAASGFILLCYNPFWIYDVGFQLSFLAVLSILLFNKTITNWWQPKNFFLKKLWELIAISVSVQILVFPLVIYYFNQFPILVFMANIPAGFYSTILMIGAIIIFIAASLNISCIWVGQVLIAITKVFNSFVILLSSWSPANFRNLYIDTISYWLIMVIITLLCICYYYKSIKQLHAALVCGLVLVIYFIHKEDSNFRQERIVVYNLSKENQIDLFKEKCVTHLYPTNQTQYKYALTSSQLGFGAAYQKTAMGAGNIYRINGKSVLILGRAAIQQGVTFPVDILIVSKDCPFQPELWFHTFHPKMIILGGDLPRWKGLQWKEALQSSGAKVHWVSDEGAWIYPAL